MDTQLHERDGKRMRRGGSEFFSKMKVTPDDIGKILVVNHSKTLGMMLSREAFLEMDVDEIGEWCEVDEFDVNTT